jgi:hypothetical protein
MTIPSCHTVPSSDYRVWLRQECALCEDCDAALGGDAVTVCARCERRRAERKDIIQEIIQSEASYGQDLRIIHEVRQHTMPGSEHSLDSCTS